MTVQGKRLQPNTCWLHQRIPFTSFLGLKLKRDYIAGTEGSSNTPLREVIDASPVAEKKIIVVENYPKTIESLPENLQEVLHRARDIIFSDKTLHNVKMSRVITKYLRFIDELYKIVEEHADISKLDIETRRKIQSKYNKFKMERGAEIKSIRYITREEKHPHIYENADFSATAIKNSIREGETRAKEVLRIRGEE